MKLMKQKNNSIFFAMCLHDTDIEMGHYSTTHSCICICYVCLYFHTHYTCPRKSVRGPEGTLAACACCACVRECACVCVRVLLSQMCA
jgi:hypothetical protein